MTDRNFGPYVKKIGSKYYPKGRPIIHSDSLWQEKHWEARQEVGGRCFFEFLVGRHGGGTDTYEISVAEFNAVKAGKLSYEDLIRLTDQNPNRLPFGS